MEIQKAKFYKIGERVSKSGMYVCIPCGFVQYFQEGSDFETCQACFAGTGAGPQGFQENAEFWQFLS